MYYRFAIKVDEKVLGISRDALADAMAAEGFPLSKGYVKPIYLINYSKSAKRSTILTSRLRKIPTTTGTPDYSKGTCPSSSVCSIWNSTLTDICQHPYTTKHVDLFLTALKKCLPISMNSPKSILVSQRPGAQMRFCPSYKHFLRAAIPYRVSLRVRRSNSFDPQGSHPNT